MTATYMTMPLVSCMTNTSNPLYWNKLTLVNTIPVKMVRIKNWSLFTMVPRRFGCWKYETMEFLPHHMSSILVESWDAFKVYSVAITGESFVKKTTPSQSFWIWHQKIGMYCLCPNIFWGAVMKTSMWYHIAPLNTSRYKKSGQMILWLSFKQRWFDNNLGIYSSNRKFTILRGNKPSPPVARNGILSLKLRYYGPNGDNLDYWGIITFWFIILLYPIKGWIFIVSKQWICEDYTVTMVPVENTILVITVVFIVQYKILWCDSYGVERWHIADTFMTHKIIYWITHNL